MEVRLIDYTKNAEELLLLAKYTRLSNDSSKALDIIRSWNSDKVKEELNYALNTIESTFEFIHFTFSISGVDRNFTHQLVRQRDKTLDHTYAGVSFAQMSGRTVDSSDLKMFTPEALNKEQSKIFEQGVNDLKETYNKLLSMGVATQDARSILPGAIETAIIVKFDLRSLSHMLQERLCTRVQGMFQKVAQEMRKLVLEIYPWLEQVLCCYCCKVGTCRFSNYKECPIKGIQFDPNTGLTYQYADGAVDNLIDSRDDKSRPATKNEIRVAWKIMNERGGFEAIPTMQNK